MNQANVTRATLGRLPQYLEYLRSLPPETTYTSATIVAKALGLGEVQVRKDLSSVSGEGRPKLGYVTSELIGRLESYLGLNEHTAAVIVGAGKLGCALLEYGGFVKYGLDVVAAFDCDESKARPVKDGKEIFAMDRLDEYCREHNIRIGIITVPSGAAQEVCDRLIGCGVRAIWNFAPGAITVPDGVTLRQENLALSLAYLNEQLRFS